MIEGMDRSLGDLMAALDHLGVASNTIILFLSDNGSPKPCPPNLPLRGNKLTPYEGGVRVPMIVNWPGVTRPATVCRDPVVIEDVFPTVLELAGVNWRGQTLQTVDGISFAPLLKGTGSTPPDRAFIWHFPHNYAWQGPFSAIRQGPWKLIYHHTDRQLELFNIADDIGETRDRAADEPARVRELARRLADRLPRSTHPCQPTRRPVDPSSSRVKRSGIQRRPRRPILSSSRLSSRVNQLIPPTRAASPADGSSRAKAMPTSPTS